MILIFKSLYGALVGFIWFESLQLFRLDYVKREAKKNSYVQI